MIQVNTHGVQLSMYDATSLPSDSPLTPPSVEHLQQEVLQLKDKLTWYETEYRKLAKMISASNGRKETHLSPGGSPWLPFDSPEELEQAKKEAEAEAQKLLDERK